MTVFLLAEQLLGEEESFLPSAAIVKEYHFLSEMQGSSFPVGSIVCIE